MELFQPDLNVQMLFLGIRRDIIEMSVTTDLFLFFRYLVVFEKVVHDSLYNHVRNTITATNADL